MNIAVSALSVSRHFLSIPTEDPGDLISNLKLQKLLYYSQGCWIALHGVKNPLFHEKIYAWKHGPVVKTAYNHYARYGDASIPLQSRMILRADIPPFLNEVYRVFGKFSAWKLRDMTHREAPWVDNYKPNVMNIEIPLIDLERYFSKHVQKA